jgi:hypothetical protein
VGGGGGTSTQELVQAGISSKMASNGNQMAYAWWEVISGNNPKGKTVNEIPMLLDNGKVMYVKPGDQIWIYIGSNADHNSGYDGFLVEDLTQGTSAIHYEYDPTSFSDSSTAECIVERTTLINTQTHQQSFALLANFPNPIKITGCGVYTNSQAQYAMAPIGNFSPAPVNMVDKNNILLASTDVLKNGSDFDVIWHDTGDGT